MKTDVFALRHIGIAEEDYQKMLKKIGVDDLNQLISETIPNDIRLNEKLDLPYSNERTRVLGAPSKNSPKKTRFTKVT